MTFQYEDDQASRIVDAFCTLGGYSATLANGEPNSETRPQFTKRMIRNWIVSQVREHEKQSIGVEIT